MNMERLEKMEGVLMDYVVGETSAEVSAMVEALMEREELVRAKVEEWRGVVGSAREAMGERVEAELPAFEGGRMERARFRAKIGRGFLWGAGMAACVGVGIWLGSGRGMKQDVPPVGTEVSAVGHGEAARVVGVADFWSVSRLKADVVASGSKGNGVSEELSKAWERSVRFGG